METIKINFHHSRYNPHVPARYMFIASGVPKQFRGCDRQPETPDFCILFILIRFLLIKNQ